MSDGIHWRHVRSANNPADIVCRGHSAEQLPTTIWFYGVQRHSSECPSEPDDRETAVPDRRKTVALQCKKPGNESILMKMILSNTSNYHIHISGI